MASQTMPFMPECIRNARFPGGFGTIVSLGNN